MAYFLPQNRLFLSMQRCISFHSAKRPAIMAISFFLSVTSLMAQEFSLDLEYDTELTNVNGTVFFPAYTYDSGTELWKSDGTSQGTVLVKDIVPGSGDPGVFSNFTKVGNRLFFVTDDLETSKSVWKSDGTAQGTVKVKSFPDAERFYQLTDVNGTLYFLVGIAIDSYQLWKSDGTEAGTVMLKSFITPVCDCPYPVSYAGSLHLVNGNGTLYFTSMDKTYGLELWKSNGTSTGTVLVKDIRPGISGSEITSLVYWNGNVYFDASDGSVSGRELWKSNGTAQSTVIVKDIVAGAFGSYPGNFKLFNGALYFAATGSYNQAESYQYQNYELWKTDGTAQGTVLVKDIAPGSYGSYPSQFTVANSTLFFTADHDRTTATDHIAGELWKSDGTAQGTVLVKDIAPGTAGSVPVELTAVNGNLFFAADTEGVTDGFQTPNRALWKSNGTAQETVLVKDVAPLAGDSYPTRLTAVNGTLLFVADENGRISRPKLWKTDGTTQGTVELKVQIPAATCSATGSISREYWANVSGSNVSNIPLHTTPASSTQLSSFEAPTSIADNYGQRVRGFICAPYSGSYTFYIASDDQSELWLSNSENPEAKRKIASVTGYTGSRQWTKYASQKSAAIFMERGRKYYIEALHKEATGGDNLAVGWNIPGTSTISVISGSSLSPYVENQAPVITITSPLHGEKVLTSPASLTVTATASDKDGTVSRVEFYAGPGGSLSAYDDTAPYSVTWNNVEAGSYPIMARVVDNQAATTDALVTVTVDGLSSPWANVDVGTTGITGSAGYRDGMFTLKSSGYDFYKAPDSFHYVYQPFSGNATIVAKVESIGNTHPNALAGIMIREYFGASSSFVAVAVDPSGNTNFRWRQGAGIPGYKSVAGAAPRWLKLSRNGNSITASFSLDGSNWNQLGTITVTMDNTIYTGMVLTSQNSTQLNTATFSHVSVSASDAPIACSASGTILREYWANVKGGNVSDIPINTTPAFSTQLSSFETPANSVDNYGQRIRGYICAPATGSYTFYLAADDQAELWLSKDDNPDSKQKMATVSAWTNAKQWTKYPSQKSVVVTLEKGKKYYIEALHKEAVYGDNLAVGWTIPGNSSITVIPGSVLSPFVGSAARLASEEAQPNGQFSVYPNPFEDKLIISASGLQGKVVISLTDVVGKAYFRKEYELSGQREVELDLAALQLKAGIHLLRLQTEDGQTKVVKMVKK